MLTRAKRANSARQEPLVSSNSVSSVSSLRGSRTAAKVGKAVSKIMQLVVGGEDEDEPHHSKVKPPNHSPSDATVYDISDIMTDDEDVDEPPEMGDIEFYYNNTQKSNNHLGDDDICTETTKLDDDYDDQFVNVKTNSTFDMGENYFNTYSENVILENVSVNVDDSSDDLVFDETNFMKRNYMARFELRRKSFYRKLKQLGSTTLEKYIQTMDDFYTGHYIRNGIDDDKDQGDGDLQQKIFNEIMSKIKNKSVAELQIIKQCITEYITSNQNTEDLVIENTNNNEGDSVRRCIEIQDNIIINTSESINNEKVNQVTNNNGLPLDQYGILTYYVSSEDDASSCKITGTYDTVSVAKVSSENVSKKKLRKRKKKKTNEKPKIYVKKISEINRNVINSIKEPTTILNDCTTREHTPCASSTGETSAMLVEPTNTNVNLNSIAHEVLRVDECDLNKQSDILSISSEEELPDALTNEQHQLSASSIGVQTLLISKELTPVTYNAEVFQTQTKDKKASSEKIHRLMEQDHVETISDTPSTSKETRGRNTLIDLESPLSTKYNSSNKHSPHNAILVDLEKGVPPSSKKRKKAEDDEGTKQKKVNKYETSRTNAKIIADKHDIDRRTSENIVKFFDQDYTIPFIARYRKSDINNLEANVLREIKETYDEVLELKKKKYNVLKALEKKGDTELKEVILKCTSLDELNSFYIPIATTRVNKLSVAVENGLEKAAMNILEDQIEENLYKYVKPNIESLSNIQKVEESIVLILANYICSRPEILNIVDAEKKLDKFFIKSKKSKSPRTGKDYSYLKEERKYETYYDFSIKASKIYPHQILALNRGKDQKMLNITYTHVYDFLDKIERVCGAKWRIQWYTKRGKLLKNAIQYGYDKIVCPMIQKHVKAELKLKAEKCSINVFTNNLRQILLKAPVKGRPVLGIDPGFKNGCKMALISHTGSILETHIIYPHVNVGRRGTDDVTLQRMLQKYSCELIALGNGKGCKETEMWLAHLIQKNFFAPLEVNYAIVNESGSSIYSCSKEATAEFPKMDPCLISAIHLARRFQDPLLELVKLDPKHLGVGMYQHDLTESKLQKALDTVISECVSNVGIDLNTASLYLLKHIAGLTTSRAAGIIAYRDANGPFKTREQLKKVRGIGDKTFEQCAGFLRIVEGTVNNKLDSTIIHPESYDVAIKVLKSLNLTVDDIGDTKCIAKVNAARSYLYEKAEKLETTKDCMKLIVDSLSSPLDYDFRGDFEVKPLMHNVVTSFKQLMVGHILEGRAMNITTFGCFIDVGCEKNGLIHAKEMENVILGIGDKIQVEVLSFDLGAMRLSLRYLKHV